MGATTFPTVGSGKTRYCLTLLSGTSWTVPVGVTYVNVTLVGGGGGGGASPNGTNGAPGQVVRSVVATTPGSSITYAIGYGGAAGSSSAPGGQGGTTSFTGATSALGGYGGLSGANSGAQSITGTPGSENNYGIGAPSSGSGSIGGAGKIDVEYWV